jgi:hypothetical protein
MFAFLTIVVIVGLFFYYENKKKKNDIERKSEEVVFTVPLKFQLESETDHYGEAPRPSIDKDDWEGSFWEVNQPKSVKANIRIKYTDASGRHSERSVAVRRFGAIGPNTLIIGHCAHRNATRTFRSDRIESCIDEETGEIIPDLASYLGVQYEKSPDRTRDELLETEFDTLRVLLYVGKADGQLRAAEKTVIRETCITITKDSRLTEKDISDLLAQLDVPTVQAFKMAVGRIDKRDASVKSLVLQASIRIVETQKSIHQSEQEAIDYMRKRFELNVTAAA